MRAVLKAVQAVASICVLTGGSAAAGSTELALAGVFADRAVLQADDGRLHTLRIGERTADGVKLVSISGSSAVVELDGRRQRLELGGGPIRTEVAERAALTLVADQRGHHFAEGRVNGARVRFLVDTGATLVSLGRSDAQRAGLDFRKGAPTTTSTANGVVRVWRMRIDALEVEGMKLHNVDAAIHENDLPVSLLGMSFLNRMQWRREGDALILEKRY